MKFSGVQDFKSSKYGRGRQGLQSSPVGTSIFTIEDAGKEVLTAAANAVEFASR